MFSNARLLSAVCLAAALPLAGCQFYTTVSSAGDLGVGDVRYPSILLSAPDTEASKSIPVVVSVHGFGATAYETEYAANYLAARGFLISRPNLGKHGSATMEEFTGGTWQDWAGPIADEYKRLKAVGYKNVQFLTVSTGGPIVMELLSRSPGAFLPDEPKRITMVAPLLDSTDKMLGGVGLLQFLGAKGRPTKQTGQRIGRHYSDWPTNSLRQLLDLTEVMKGRLRKTINVSDSTRIQIFQSNGDGTVDPVSAEMWSAGIRGGLVSVYKLDSTFHVPIGNENVVDGKSDYEDKDKALRDRILDQIVAAHKL